MTNDIQTFGAADVGDGYYFIRESNMSGVQVVSIRIDAFGNVHRMGARHASAWTPEELDAIPTRQEAIEQHLAPAFAQAEARVQAEVDRRRREGAPPPQSGPPPVDPATQRFLDADEHRGAND